MFKTPGDASHVEGLQEAFLREAELLDQLSRRAPAIVRAHRVGRCRAHEGTPLLYMVLEWLEGLPLSDVAVPEGGWQLDTLIELFDPVARALADCHDAGIAHRDLKPSNIFVTFAGDAMTLKLLDFGIAKVAEDRPGGFLSTATGVAMFTLSYAAPEQLQGAATGPWTDVYALAMTLCVMLVGDHPYAQASAVETMVQITDERRRPTPAALGANVSDDVEAVFRRALAVGTNQRHRDVASFWAELREASR